jgi:hypothetical protein
MLQAVEQVVSREQLEAAVATVLELLPLPSAEDDGIWSGGWSWSIGTARSSRSRPCSPR